MKTFRTIALTLACLLIPSAGFAELYKYQKPNGEVVISTEKRSDLKLVEIVSGSGQARKPKRKTPRTPSTSSKGAAHKQVVEAPQRSDKESAFDDIIREASKAYDVPFGFVKAVVRVESNFNPNAVSPVGAMGLMQLMPRTAASLNVTNAFDPRQNIYGGAKFLRILIDRYNGDINLILAAYNAGDAAVARYDGIPYAKTRGYVASVFRWYQHYSAETTEN